MLNICCISAFDLSVRVILSPGLSHCFAEFMDCFQALSWRGKIFQSLACFSACTRKIIKVSMKVHLQSCWSSWMLSFQTTYTIVDLVLVSLSFSHPYPGLCFAGIPAPFPQFFFKMMHGLPVPSVSRTQMIYIHPEERHIQRYKSSGMYQNSSTVHLDFGQFSAWRHLVWVFAWLLTLFIVWLLTLISQWEHDLVINKQWDDLG